MIDRCVNPACKSSLPPLRSGQLYSLDRRTRDTEFFWLCGDCSRTLRPVLRDDGAIKLTDAVGRRCAVAPHKDHDLRLVAQLRDAPRWHFQRDSQRPGKYSRDVAGERAA